MFLTKIQFARKAGRYSWTRISILPCLLIPRLSSVTLMDVAGENQFVPICLVLLSPSLLSPFLSRDITVRERHFARAQHAAWSILNKEASRTLRVGKHAYTYPGQIIFFSLRCVLFTSIFHGSRYNFYWLPRIDSIRFEHSNEMNCNICRLHWRAYFRATDRWIGKPITNIFAKTDGRNGKSDGGEWLIDVLWRSSNFSW